MLALESKKLDAFTKDLDLISGLIKENPEYTSFLASPAMELSVRLAAIDEAFATALQEETLSFLKLLCKNGRIKDLKPCIEEFFKLKTVAENRTTATVYYALPLTNEQKSALLKKLEASVQKKVDMIFIEDKSLLGGLKIELDGKVLDGSVKHHLEEVKGVMNR